MKHTAFQKELRNIIAQKGDSQSVFAQKLGVSQNTLESWMADEEKKWSRQPGRFEKIGILSEARALLRIHIKPK